MNEHMKSVLNQPHTRRCIAQEELRVSKSVTWPLVLVLAAVCFVSGSSPIQPAAGANSTLALFLNTSFSDTLNGIAATNCSTYSDAVRCNSSTACFWNSTIADNALFGGPAFACRTRGLFSSSSPSSDWKPHSWCYSYFPLVFIAIVFFLCAFLSGGSFVGVIYCVMHYDVYSTRLDTGETVFNQFYYRTAPIVLYCAALFVTGTILGVSAWAYWISESVCLYVPMVFIYLIVLAVFFVGYPAYRLFYYLRERLHNKAKDAFDVDEHISPQTRRAMPPRANQVRCF